MCKEDVTNTTCFGSYVFSKVLVKDFIAEFSCGLSQDFMQALS